MKQWGKIYQCFVRPVLLYFCETYELTVVAEVRLHWVEHHMIRMICGARPVDRVSTDVLHGRVGVAEDMVIQTVCDGMVMSWMETSIHKYVRL